MLSDDVVIRVDDLGKCYQIYDKPVDRLKQSIRPRLKKLLGRHQKQYFSEFWALKDVSFEVRKGGTVGIIGRNGSGKSTLLQIICGTLNPTIGSVTTQGRIAALLELGAGFNPEFTGRENVYMNASVLGLSNEEIDARFEDIIAFADIGDFIEQPVKTYSSGMYVRLAFAVVAHVDAEILVIDEALTVGDAVFTQKCMRFLRKFKESGTLIFVSHDMASVLNLCEKAIWLHSGELIQSGESSKIVQDYLQYTLQELYGQDVSLDSIDPAKSSSDVQTSESSLALSSGADIMSKDEMEATFHVKDNLSFSDGWKSGVGEILSVAIEKVDSDARCVYRGGEKVCVVITARAHQDIDQPILGFIVRDRLGQDLFGENTLSYSQDRDFLAPEGSTFSAEFVFRMPMLPNGKFAVVASLASGDLNANVQHHWLHDALIIDVFSSKVRWGLVGVNVESVKLKVR